MHGLPPDYSLRNRLRPGDLGYITYLHGSIYSEEYGFDLSFEKYVFEPLCDFALGFSNETDRIWIIERGPDIVGCVAIVECEKGKAQLRWLILKSEERGKGLGRMLVQLAVDFCKVSGYDEVFLWTVSELVAARYLYESMDFILEESHENKIWGRVLVEEKYVLEL